MNIKHYPFETDSKFNVTAAILLLAVFATLSVWIVICGMTNDLSMITTISGAFRMWGLWIVIFAILLIPVAVRVILYYVDCIRNKRWADGTKGEELTALAVIVGVLLVGVGIPKIITTVGEYADISLFNSELYSPLVTATMVTVFVWFILFVGGLVLSVISDIIYNKNQAKLEKEETEKNELSQS